MKIIKGEARHARELHETEKESFSIPWTEASIRYEISQDISICFVAIDDAVDEVGIDEVGIEKILGHVYMRQVFDEGEIINIAVKKIFRCKGVAKFLLRELFAEAKIRGIKKIFLDVRESNLPAINLYKKFGFVAAGTRKFYYSQPFEDAIIMQTTLNPNH